MSNYVSQDFKFPLYLRLVPSPYKFNLIGHSQLRKQDTSFQKTKCSITKLIRLYVEAGGVTGENTGVHRVKIVYVAKQLSILATWAGALLVLVYLPGHPPYYNFAASVVAKTYSNAMMAVLNSRIKAVSNTPELGASLWNESAKPNGSIYSSGSRRTAFGEDSETGFSSSHVPILANTP